MADDRQDGDGVRQRWTDRRIIFLTVVIALVFYAVFRLPEALSSVITRAQEIIILLILAVALTYFLLPAVNLLCSIPVRLGARVKRSIASLVAIIAFIALAGLLATVIVRPIAGEIGQVLETATQWAEEDLAERAGAQVDAILSGLPERYREEVKAHIEDVEQRWTVDRMAEAVSEWVSEWGLAVLQWNIEMISGLLSRGHFLVVLMIVPVLSYYFLTDAASIRRGIETHVPPDMRDRYHQMLEDVDAVIQGYVHTLMLIAVIIGVGTIIILYLGGVEAYLTFGILAGIANLVPVLGAIVAVIAMIAISLLQVGLQRTVIIMAVYVALELLVDRVLAPKLMSTGSRLHPVAVIIAILVGFEFFGFIGMFIAVPLVAAGRVAWIHYRAHVGDDDLRAEFDGLLGRSEESQAEDDDADPESGGAATQVTGSNEAP